MWIVVKFCCRLKLRKNKNDLCVSEGCTDKRLSEPKRPARALSSAGRVVVFCLYWEEEAQFAGGGKPAPRPRNELDVMVGVRRAAWRAARVAHTQVGDPALLQTLADT